MSSLLLDQVPPTADQSIGSSVGGDSSIAHVRDLSEDLKTAVQEVRRATLSANRTVKTQVYELVLSYLGLATVGHRYGEDNGDYNIEVRQSNRAISKKNRSLSDDKKIRKGRIKGLEEWVIEQGYKDSLSTLIRCMRLLKKKARIELALPWLISPEAADWPALVHYGFDSVDEIDDQFGMYERGEQPPTDDEWIARVRAKAIERKRGGTRNPSKRTPKAKPTPSPLADQAQTPIPTTADRSNNGIVAADAGTPQPTEERSVSDGASILFDHTAGQAQADSVEEETDLDTLLEELASVRKQMELVDVQLNPFLYRIGILEAELQPLKRQAEPLQQQRSRLLSRAEALESRIQKLATGPYQNVVPISGQLAHRQ